MDSRFHGNDTNTIIVIPAKAGIHPMQDSFPRYLPKSHFSLAFSAFLDIQSFEINDTALHIIQGE
jgi:hypothetical protein